MAAPLHGKRIALIATHGFEQSELVEPKQALEDAGARVDILAPEGGTIRGWTKKDWGDEVRVDRPIAGAMPADYDAVLLPGGVMNPDALRLNRQAVAFVRDAFQAGKPIGSICHGPWMLLEAGVVAGLRMTSWPSLKTDLQNAGATWVDEEVVTDRGIVTSRKPADLPAFNRKLIEEIAEGAHGGGGRRKPAKAPANV